MPSQHTGTIQIRAARLADGISSSSKPNQAILITDGWITSVGDQDAIQQQTPPGTKIIDLGTACITPGLIDGHTHLSLAGDGRTYVEMFADSDEMMVLTGMMNLQQHLAAGITTIREHGARNKIGFTLKKGLARGYIAGPRLLTSGRPITCTGGHFHMCNEISDGEEQMRRSVQRQYMKERIISKLWPREVVQKAQFLGWHLIQQKNCMRLCTKRITFTS